MKLVSGRRSFYNLTLRAVIRLVLVLLALASLPSRPALGREDEKLALTIDCRILGDAFGLYVPLQFTVTNRGPERTLGIEVAMSPASYYKQAAPSAISRLVRKVPPGITRLELPVALGVFRFEGEATFTVDGSASEDLSCRMAGANRQSILLISDAAGVASRVKSLWTVLGSADAFRHWQLYLEAFNAVVVDAAVIARLEPAQKEALLRWVALGGGPLWLYGAEAEAQARALGIPELPPVPSGEGDLIPGTRKQRYGTGWLLTSSEAEFWQVDTLPLRFDSLQEYGQFARVNHTSIPDAIEPAIPSDLFKGLHEIPRAGYALLSLLMAALIGPVNLIVLRRRGRIAWFYLTAPVLAVTGMGLVLGYSIIHDGLGVRMRETAVLLHDPASGTGILYQARAIFAGLPPREGLSFPGETVAIPLSRQAMGSERREGPPPDPSEPATVTNWSTGLKLEAGWVRGRTDSGLFTATPLRVRMGVSVEVDAQGLKVTNGLPTVLEQVYARMPGAEACEMYSAEKVAPGASAYMSNDGRLPIGSVVYRSQDGNAHRLPFLDVPFVSMIDLDWAVLAVTGTLPYLEDGGLKGEIEQGRYFYLSLVDPAAQRGACTSRRSSPLMIREGSQSGEHR